MMIKRLLVLVGTLVSCWSQAGTVEVVTFKLKPNVTPEAFLAAAQKMEPVITAWDGFIKRELVQDHGVWIDVVHWASHDEAKKAEGLAMESDICLEFFGLIDEASITMYRADSLLNQIKK